MAKPIIDRLLDLSMPEPNSGCWLWLAQINGRGYGKLTLPNHRSGTAHRVSYEAFKGPIAKGLLVCHKCDVPLCINPDHLFLGTHQQNMRDRDNKDRANKPKGSKHPMAKLSDGDILAIRNDTRMGKDIAADYGISKSMVSLIKNRRNWTHI